MKEAVATGLTMHSVHHVLLAIEQAVHKVDELGRQLGLELNVSKCELIAD